ncbi:MAG: hypothetical protein FWD79_11105 [Desulfobulbus sp.]|nr:hypothetical protein [Desulfobulbus sp.]
MNGSLALCTILLLVLTATGCRTEDTQPSSSLPRIATSPDTTLPIKIGCVGCHDDMRLDASHQLGCTVCHGGQDNESQADKAHIGLIAHPSHPSHMADACGGCHPQQVSSAAVSRHFTLDSLINRVRRHFGAEDRLTQPANIPMTDPATGTLALADDMLRRRCLRCHVYAQGDAYDAVKHGTGCGACHLAFENGKMLSHAFTPPADKQCLSCHYGNSVGSDYHGRYEHDYNWEYRTPYFLRTSRNTAPRPAGVEWHDLAPDIHQQRGLVCIDCHKRSGHNRQEPRIACITCHGWRPGQPTPALGTLLIRDQTLVLTGRMDGKEHTVPLLHHPAHRQYDSRVACQVCHGQWSFNDAPTSLLLSYRQEYEPWERLTVQGSSEVEALLEHNLHYSDERPLSMRDGLTGESRAGIWYLGYGQRRWEQMIVRQDTDGVIKVFRPYLDLRLSMVKADGQAPFDNIVGQDSGFLPYTPHTTGAAGLFFLDRFRHLLPADEK